VDSEIKQTAGLKRYLLIAAGILLYLNHRTVSRGTKIVTISFLWVTIGISVFCVTNIYIRILLLFIAAAVTVHVALLGTCGRDAQNPEECGEEIKP